MRIYSSMRILVGARLVASSLDSVGEFGLAEVTRWKWDFDDGETGTGEQPLHIYHEADTYTGLSRLLQKCRQGRYVLCTTSSLQHKSLISNDRQTVFRHFCNPDTRTVTSATGC